MYTVRLKLELSKSEERFMSKCFFFMNTIHNRIVSHAQNRINALFHDSDYMSARMEYGQSGFAKKKSAQLSSAQKKRKKQLSQLMKDKQIEYSLRQTDLERYAKILHAKYVKFISSQQVQAEAKAVYSGVAKVLFGDGMHLHFKPVNQFDCIKQKCATNGVKVIEWNTAKFMNHLYQMTGLPDTPYMKAVRSQTVLYADVVYTYLKRIEFSAGFQYYVIITLRGEAPKNFHKCNHKNRTGVDFGTSSIATSSNNVLHLEELAPLSDRYERQIRHLQNLADRSMRLHNPENYNSNGTVKKGKHHWELTKRCRKLKRMIRVLYRKQSAYVRDSHRAFINTLLQESSEFILEPMEFAGLQKKAKTTERSDKLSTVTAKDGTVKKIHKFKRKKRYGRSIKNRSPGLMQSELKRKAEQYDIPYFEINRTAYKASQLHHDTGEYIKPKLSERFKVIDGHKVQRDLYSAFLICSTSSSLTIPDFEICNSSFPRFVEMHNILINNMKKRGFSMKQCFGF